SHSPRNESRDCPSGERAGVFLRRYCSGSLTGLGRPPIGRAHTTGKPAMSEPQPELGPAMRALPLRWQKAVTALFVVKGNRSAALRAAGYKAKPNSLHVLASRIFADDRVRAAVRELAARMIEIAEPELLATTLDIMRDTATRPTDRLAA